MINVNFRHFTFPTVKSNYFNVLDFSLRQRESHLLLQLHQASVYIIILPNCRTNGEILQKFAILFALLAVSILVIGAIGCGVGFREPTTIVTFRDPNLEDAIRRAIKKPVGDIYQSDVENLTALYDEGGGIADLSGLEYCTNLEILYLWTNPISDISQLSALTNLRVLDISRNQISDISPLVGLTELTELNLLKNNIADISALSELDNLSRLAAGRNPISDLSPLSNLKQLKMLILDRCGISDIAPIYNLTGLTSLNLWRNKISDISPLTQLGNLTYLILSENEISDISPLVSLNNLRQLQLAVNQISDISPLLYMSSLRGDNTLDLRGNPLNNESVNLYIPQLLQDGVKVLWESPSEPTPEPTEINTE